MPMIHNKLTIKRHKKRKKIRYRKMNLKITEKQKKQMLRFCRAKRTTPVRLIKKALLEYMERYGADIPEEVVVSKNQLKLFDPAEESKAGHQTVLFNL